MYSSALVPGNAIISIKYIHIIGKINEINLT